MNYHSKVKPWHLDEENQEFEEKRVSRLCRPVILDEARGSNHCAPPVIVFKITGALSVLLTLCLFAV